MKIIVISVANRLLSGAIVKYIRESGELMPIRVTDNNRWDEPYNTCKSHNTKILLMGVMKVPPFTLEERLETSKKIKETIPECKIVLLCDENIDQDIPEGVKNAKKLGFIDGFLYSSVSGEYLSAMLDAL